MQIPGEDRSRQVVTALAVSLCIVAVVIAAKGVRDGARTENVEAARATNHDLCKSIPDLEYRRDWSRVVSGTLVTTGGVGISDVTVRLYDVNPGVAFDPTNTSVRRQPEVVATTSADGGFRFVGMSLGAKLLVATKAGFATATSTEQIVIDGAGGFEANIVLEAPLNTQYQVVMADSKVVSGRDLELLSRLSDQDVYVTRADDCGIVDVPAHLMYGRSLPLMRIAQPPLEGGLSVEPIAIGQALMLPAQSPLVVRIVGLPAGGGGRLTLAATDTQVVGLSTVNLNQAEAEILIPALWHGRYLVTCEAPGWAGSIDIDHQGAQSCEIPLSQLKSMAVHLFGPDEGKLEARMRIASFNVPTTLEILTDVGFSLAESWNHAENHVEHYVFTGEIVLENQPRMRKWLSIEARGCVPQVVEVSEDCGCIELNLQKGERLGLRTPRPYSLAEVRGSDGSVQIGRSDSFGDIHAWVPAGPTFARCIVRGRASGPLGRVMRRGDHLPPLRFTVADATDVNLPGVYGFVLDQDGHPVSGAEVIYQGARGAARMLNANSEGLFRLPARNEASYILSARRSGQLDAAWVSVPVSLQRLYSRPTLGRRVDLRVWNGHLLLDSDGLRGLEECWLLDDAGVVVHTFKPEPGVSHTITNLRPGWYTLKSRTQNREDARVIEVKVNGLAAGSGDK